MSKVGHVDYSAINSMKLVGGKFIQWQFDIGETCFNGKCCPDDMLSACLSVLVQLHNNILE